MAWTSATKVPTAALAAFNAALFPGRVGESHSFTFRLPDGSNKVFSLVAADVVKVPVPQVKVLDTAAGKVGYFQFNSYVSAAQPQLISAIEQFNAANIKELVLDLRYNGGCVYWRWRLNWDICWQAHR